VGQYLEAAEALIEAYAIEPNPAFLFNIGRSYQRAGLLEDAATFYERCLADEEAPPEVAARAQTGLDVVREELEQRRKASVRSVPAAPSAPSPPATLTPQQLDVHADGTQNRFPGWILLGGGGAGLIAGGTFGWLASRTIEDHRRSSVQTEKNQLAGVARQQALVSDISTSLGVASLVVGAVWIFREHSEPTVRSAWVGPSAEGAVIGGTW
jgi:hypothetical protein